VKKAKQRAGVISGSCWVMFVLMSNQQPVTGISATGEKIINLEVFVVLTQSKMRWM